MEDENSGAQGVLEDAQTGQDAQAQAGQEGASSAQVGKDADADYKGIIEERDRRIAELEAQAAEAAKSAERAEKMSSEIAELCEQAKSDRIDFELRLAGVRNVKAARAVLEDHGGDVARLKEAEPWLFSAGNEADDDGESGSTGLPNAGISKEEGLYAPGAEANPACANAREGPEARGDTGRLRGRHHLRAPRHVRRHSRDGAPSV